MKIGSRSLEVLSSFKMVLCSVDYIVNHASFFERTRLIFFRNKNIARPCWITLRFFYFNFEKQRESVNLLMYVLFSETSIKTSSLLM